MPETIPVEQLIALNPGVDKDQLKKTSESLRELQQNGIERRGYHLATPLTRRRAAARDSGAALYPRRNRLRSRR